MKIIGIHDGHNATVCLLEDGIIKWVIQEERIRREKNFDGFPEQALRKILQLESLTPFEIDAVVLNGNHQPLPMNRLERIEAFKRFSSKKNLLRCLLKKIDIIDTLYQKANNRKRMQKIVNLGFGVSQIHFVEHHKAHAAAAYYGNNNFNEKVLILTNDGAGDRICATISIGNKGNIQRIASVREEHSIGLLYAMFTFLMGMVPLEHEYKIMGMAPYTHKKGARLVASEFNKMFSTSKNGLTWKFEKGASIYTSLEYFREFMYLKRFDYLMAGLQLFLEDFLSNWVKAAIKHTGIRKIVLSGGTFMNVKANKIIMELDEVDELFVFPSCGDESNAIGAAYNYHAKSANFQTIQKLQNIYFGICFNDAAILSSFKKYDFKHKYHIEKVDNIEEVVARLLAAGNVVARFSGREEFGARSLGNRAILGNPSSSNVIKTINNLIKNRDFWMPFASSILDNSMEKYVYINKKNDPYYMIMTYDTKCEADEIIGGIHPYDKTVRPQLVTKKHNAEYWKIINEFKKITGIGAILNTSLNLHGMPLVHNPEDAFEVLEKSKLQYLAIGNYVINKIDK